MPLWVFISNRRTVYLMRTAYLDCFSGISGDMLLGALVHAGVREQTMISTLGNLACTGYTVNISPTQVSSLQATRVQVDVEDRQPHRNLADIRAMLLASPLDEQVQHESIAVFRRLAEAEATVHGCSPDEVHFHEVGAVDAIVDVVGSIAGLHSLDIDRLICSPLPVPRGWVNCHHGELPVPAPAVCELLQGVPIYGVDIDQELVTPTGAAIIRELADHFGPMPPMCLTTTGYGAGSRSRNDGRPNLLRIMIGDDHSPEEAQQVVVIETALDDWSPETWPHVAEKLLHNGALDVLLTPVHMKKGRPGFVLSTVSDHAHAEGLKKIILSETSAIGLRFHTEKRFTLPREIIEIETKWGLMKAKKIETPVSVTITPEYEECRRIASEYNISINEVYTEIHLQTAGM